MNLFPKLGNKREILMALEKPGKGFGKTGKSIGRYWKTEQDASSNREY